MTLRQKIQSLLTAANTKTQAQDTNLTSAVGRLITGYEAGGVSEEAHTYTEDNQAIQEFVGSAAYNDAYTTSTVGSYTGLSYADAGKPKGKSVSVPNGVLTQDSNGRSLQTTVSAGSVTLYNQHPGKTGSFRVTSGGKVLAFGTLTPSVGVRVIYGSTLKNVRDLGGWTCSGGTVRYGVLYRGTELDGYNAGNTPVSAADQAMLETLLGIGAELDLRESTEGGSIGTLSGTYLHQPIGNYAQIFSNASQIAKVRTALEFLMRNAVSGTPTYFHCVAGADRTGTLSWLLLGLLGVSRSDCDKEYEITSFSGPIRARTTYLGALYSAISELGGTSFRENIILAFKELGISNELVNHFLQAMVDGSPEDVQYPMERYSEDVQDLKACTRMKWSASSTSTKLPGNNNGSLALALTGGTLWPFTDRENNACTAITVPAWADQVCVTTTDTAIKKYEFRSYDANGTAVGDAEYNTTGIYSLSGAPAVICINAIYSDDGTIKPSWTYSSNQITVTFSGVLRQ